MIEARAGLIQWSESLNGAHGGGRSVPAPARPWPATLDVSRVVTEVGLRQFRVEILERQPATAETGALVLKPKRRKLPRALVYVEPLRFSEFEEIQFLVDSRYRAQLVRDPHHLPRDVLATAVEPHGY